MSSGRRPAAASITCWTARAAARSFSISTSIRASNSASLNAPRSSGDNAALTDAGREHFMADLRGTHAGPSGHAQAIPSRPEQHPTPIGPRPLALASRTRTPTPLLLLPPTCDRAVGRRRTTAPAPNDGRAADRTGHQAKNPPPPLVSFRGDTRATAGRFANQQSIKHLSAPLGAVIDDRRDVALRARERRAVAIRQREVPTDDELMVRVSGRAARGAPPS
jgi:hypothetical protein